MLPCKPTLIQIILVHYLFPKYKCINGIEDFFLNWLLVIFFSCTLVYSFCMISFFLHHQACGSIATLEGRVEVSVPPPAQSTPALALAIRLEERQEHSQSSQTCCRSLTSLLQQTLMTWICSTQILNEPILIALSLNYFVICIQCLASLSIQSRCILLNLNKCLCYNSVSFFTI